MSWVADRNRLWERKGDLTKIVVRRKEEKKKRGGKTKNREGGQKRKHTIHVNSAMYGDHALVYSKYLG
jgi:hypothetical protein